MTIHSPTHAPTESEIQHAAYYLWLEQGRPLHHDLEIWLAAKERLSHRVHPPGNAFLPRSAHPLPSDAQAGVRRRR